MRKNSSYSMEINKFADLTREEFRESYMGLSGRNPEKVRSPT